jgi:hypothetical protein
VALYGMNPVTFLTTQDSFLRETMQAIAAEAEKVQRQHNDELAIRIANAVGKMLGG